MPGYTGFRPQEEAYVSPALRKELAGNQAGTYKVPGMSCFLVINVKVMLAMFQALNLKTFSENLSERQALWQITVRSKEGSIATQLRNIRAWLRQVTSIREISIRSKETLKNNNRINHRKLMLM